MNQPLSLKLLRPLYDAAMAAAIPLLKSHHRLEDGYDERTLSEALPSGVDLWIQAASAGEAHLAVQLMEQLESNRRLRVLATTCTRQGRDILEAAERRMAEADHPVRLHPAYLPFDKPSLMRRAVNHVQPRAMVLLETELWPGLLWALKRKGVPTILVNGRMRTRSLARYLAAKSVFGALAPDEILAVSEEDARRFASLFPSADVSTMHNMKFDRFARTEPVPYTKNPLAKFFRPATPLLVMGSMRDQERLQTARIIQQVKAERPHTVTAVFPRHMHHIQAFAETFERQGVSFILRSQAEGPVHYGTTLLWDEFGELNLAYWLAKAVFVGGSLAPLGGQNFLEPLACGVVPAMGPHWFNFAWVGREVLDQELALVAEDADEAARLLVDQMGKHSSWEDVREQAFAYVEARQGGTKQACGRVAQRLRTR